MPLTNAGRDLIAQLVKGEAVAALTSANARIGVGDSATAFAQAQTDLQAAVNKLRLPMDATYPQRSGNVLTYRVTADATQANFNWNEWGAFNAGAGGTMFSRKQEALGLKPNTQIWQLTVSLTIQAA